MEEKNGDNEEKRENERLYRSYNHRRLSNDNDQINKYTRRSIAVSIIENNDQSPTIENRRSERTSQPMRSSQHISNTFLNNQKTVPNDDETSTYSFRHVTKQLQHAKSHGQLYQPQTPLPLPTVTNSSNIEQENDVKYRQKHSMSTSSQRQTRNRASSTTAVPILARQTMISSDDTFNSSSSSQKIPLWKRFKKILVSNKRNKDRSKFSSYTLASQSNQSSNNETNNYIINRTVPDTTVNNNNNNLLQNPIKLNELRTWIVSKPFPDQRIRDEYEKLPTESLHSKTIALRPENKAKNRFTAIEPYDHSRVVLNPLSNDPSSDYINASYIDGYRSSKLYIASQAPTDATLYDFIRMIWQLRIQSIIMVTRLFEDGKCKCIQYWPDEGEKRVQDFRIRIENEEKYADYTIRKFLISNQFESSDMLIVKQYHFISWPDHGSLALSTPLLDFRQRFRSDYRPSSPVLVHCSAGVGRSGTFIALDSLLEAAEYEDTIDVLDFTYRMRQNRVYMIQTVDQYVFLYRTLIEGILTLNTTVSLQEYLTTKKLRMDSKTQYKLLEQFQSTIEYLYRSALEPVNRNKNRVETILAPDNNRPYLMTQVDKTTDYINAVFVNSYRHAPRYIITQYPLIHTCIDFWRLVYDHNVSIIMLLEPIPRDSKTTYYWNTNLGQPICYGPFQVILVSQKEDEQLIERVFEINFLNKNLFTNDQMRTIRQFQAKDNLRLLPIVKRFLREMRTYNDQNVILQCLNGVTWSGYFAALCNSIDKMQTEQIIDPFKIVRLLRSIRSQFIDQEQYESLILSMRDYIQQYLSTNPSSYRTLENLSPINTSGQDQSTTVNRITLRL